MLSFTQKGDWEKTRKELKRMADSDIFADLDRYGKEGVRALAASTPARSGETARSWQYRVIRDRNQPGIEWYNTNKIAGGTSVAILIQYGHGTGTGGYVAGRDFINPAMRPIFDKIAADVWKKVIS